MSMTLIYDGVDLSAYRTKYGFKETLRVVSGKNSGMAINGDDIPDVIAIKRDVTITVRPLPSTDVSVLWTLVSALPQGEYSDLTYTSADGLEKTIEAMMTASGATLTMDTTERRLFEGITLTFKEK